MRRLAMFLVVGAAFAPQAWAQTSSGEAEIVVTASPLDTPLERTLQGVTVLSGEDVVDSLAAGLGETLDRQPGVASTFFGAGASRPIIRGLGEDRIRVLTNGVGQLDASTVSPDHAVASEGLEAQGIEILRGAAALAYGGNAIGGVVNVIDGRIAERPVERPIEGKVYVAATSGTDAREAAGSVTLSTGALVARIEGFDRSSEDFDIPGFAFSAAERAEEIEAGADPAEFARGTAPNSFAEAQSGAIGLSLVGEQGFVGVAFRTLDQLYGIPGHAEEGGEPAIFAGPRIDLTQDRLEVRAERRFDGAFVRRLRADAAFADYSHAEIEPSGEQGTLFTNEGVEYRLEATHRPIAGFIGAVGVSGFSQDFAAVGEEAFVTPTKTDDIGAFWIEQGEFGRLLLEGGLRLERREHDNAGDAEAAIAPRSRSFDTISGSFGVGFRPVDGAFFGVTLARSERAPTEVELFSDGPHLATAAYEIGDPNLDVESALSVEGVARWRGERLSAEISLYRSAFSDFIALAPTGDVFVEALEAILPEGDPAIPADAETLDVFAFVQQDATFTGAEATVRYDLLADGPITLAADAVFDVVRAEFDDVAGDADLPRIPPYALTLGLEGGLGRFDARVEWERVGEQDRIAAFETQTDGYDLVNLRVGVDLTADERVRVVIDGRNLTDEEARVHSSFVKDLLPRPGRTVRAALIAKF